jgi:Uma2 family endonuclease
VHPAPETRKRFTVAEFDRMAEVGILAEDDRLELIDGEIVEMNPIGPRHTVSVALLTQQLMPAADSASAHICVAGALVLGDDGEVYPDLVIRRGQPRQYRDRHATPADVLLVVEVADSSLRHDKDVKLPRYARAGVRNVWLVDVVNDHVLAYADPSAQGYRVVQSLRPGDQVRSETLPGWQFAVTDFLGL